MINKYMKHEKSWENRFSALHSGTVSIKILIRKGKFQTFRISCIMLILEILNLNPA